MHSSHFNRVDVIDMLRGLSILSVILLHLNIHIPFDKSYLGALLPPIASKVLLWSGYYGVITFFVISGFLITTSAIKRWGSLQQVKMEQFYLIRCARIFPCLIALIILLSILDQLGVTGFVINTDNTSLPRAIFAALTFRINWLEAETGYLPGAWDVLWSLSVEEVFYLFFPILCRHIKNELHFILLMLCFVVIGPFARVAFSTNEIWMDHSYLSCMDGIAFGCIAALLANKFKLGPSAIHFFMITGLCLSLFIIIFRKQASSIGLTAMGLNVTVLELGIALLVMAFHARASDSHISRNPLCWLGRNSYEIYLTHTFFVIVFAKIFYDMRIGIVYVPLGYLLVITVSGFAGHLIARYYSEPMNRMIRVGFRRTAVAVN